MGMQRSKAACALGLGIAVWNVNSAWAQDATVLPAVEVTATRLVPGPNRKPAPRGAPGTATRTRPAPAAATAPASDAGQSAQSGIVTGTIITGASSTVITAADIARSPGQTVQDILAREPGIQTTSLFGGVNGAQTTVDIRGFGATAASNTLVLVNGRRLNDIDLAGVDYSAIPREAIERIEITRGNSGAVLYGDGAVGGVINIVTKNGTDLKPSARLQGTAGSYNYYEASASASGPVGPFATSTNGNAIDSDGYRQNNRLQQKNIVGDIRWSDKQGTSAYFNLTGDIQRLGLPGGRRVDPANSINEVLTDPRGAATPFNFANKQGVGATLGVTRQLFGGTELIIDGGVRQKSQQAAFFCAFCPDFDSGVKATLTTASFTPRVSSQHTLGAMPGKLLAGIDIYDATYGSDRSLHLGDAPSHRYDLTQQTVGGYFMETIGVRPDTDFAFGARIQRNETTARDKLDPNAPGGANAFPFFQGTPFNQIESRYAWHVGIEHRVNEHFALFARTAHSFRLPTVDERVGLGDPTNFALRTQTSQDIEGGIRSKFGPVTVQSSLYRMWLRDEIFFSPAKFINTNLDPTLRYGWENIASWRVSDTLRLKAGLAYTRSVFREGPFAGADVPLVSRWTGSAGVSYDIYKQYLVFDAGVRFVGTKRMDNDAANLQTKIPSHALVDVRFGGTYEKLTWSLAAQNLFDRRYFDYAIASTFSPGAYNAYPLPGRTFLAKAGTTW